MPCVRKVMEKVKIDDCVREEVTDDATRALYMASRTWDLSNGAEKTIGRNRALAEVRCNSMNRIKRALSNLTRISGRRAVPTDCNKHSRAINT
jgi:hypothetical protein